MNETRDVINKEHSTAQDDSDHEGASIGLRKLAAIDNKIMAKEGQKYELKDELKNRADNKKQKSDSDDEDNNSKGGPSAGTTGGPSEGTGGPSEGTGGSSGGVEGSSASKVKSESPLDFVLELASLELPSFLDDLD